MAQDFDDPFEEARAFPRYDLEPSQARALRGTVARLPPPRGTGRRTADAEAPAEPAAASAAQSWFGVQLIDASGKPRAGEKYKITLSDGREVEGTLDARGIARFDEIPRGKCKVVFPELGRRAASG